MPQSRVASRGARREPLTRQRVLTSALGYVDKHGLDALTMHNLAEELGVGDMSLYNHVRNKEDLLAGVHGLLWAEIAAVLPAEADDSAWLRAFGQAIRDAGRRHGKAMAGVGAIATVFPPPMLEAIAARLSRAGAAEPDPRLVNGINTVGAFALGWAVVTSPGSGSAGEPEPETERQRIRRVARALPPDTPDRLVDVAIAVCASDLDAVFANGLEAVIAGRFGATANVPGTPAAARSASS
ncbi:MAG: TetR/AcrR family transcriptional regulator [Candidatus Dormibacteria bacterium]